MLKTMSVRQKYMNIGKRMYEFGDEFFLQPNKNCNYSPCSAKDILPSKPTNPKELPQEGSSWRQSHAEQDLTHTPLGPAVNSMVIKGQRDKYSYLNTLLSNSRGSWRAIRTRRTWLTLGEDTVMG